MKAKDIKVGNHYEVKIGGKMVVVRVEAIEDCPYGETKGYKGKGYTAFHTTNLLTGRKTVFRSAAKFRREVSSSKTVMVSADGPVDEKALANIVKAAERRMARPDPAYTRENDPYPFVKDRVEEREVARGGRKSQTGTLSTQPTTSEQESATHTSITRPSTLLSLPGDAAAKPARRESGADTGPASATKVVENLRGTLQRAVSQVTEQIPEARGLAGDQPQAFIDITTRLNEKKQVSKLVGYAGSGKTFLLAAIAKWAKRQGFEVSIAAPTHKAAAVIKSKLGASGPSGMNIEVRTIHSMLGLRLEPDWESDTGGRVLQAQDSKRKIKQGLVICDEASMVGSVLKEHIDRTPNVMWVFVGDLAQLPPVGENISELLDEPDATLDTVLRQAQGSEILNLATRIRKGDLSMEFEEGKDVHRVEDAEELFQAALEKFRDPKYQKDPSFARMLVFKNVRREAINRRMRDLIISKPEPYVPGEWLVMYAQFAPEKSKLNLMAEEARKHRKGDIGYGRAWKRFFNYKDSLGETVSQLHVSEEVRILDVGEREVSIAGSSFAVWSLKVRTKEEREFDLPVLKVEEREKHSKLLAETMAKAQDARVARDECAEGSSNWHDWDGRRKQRWGTYFSLEETFAQVDYAYAMTVHKSQGSTFDHVLVDVPDLMTSGGMQARILYTAVTRPAKSLTFYN